MGGDLVARLRGVVGAIVVGALGICSGGLFIGCASGDDPLDVFAAASLTDAFEEIAAEFSAASGVDVRLNLAGSSTLREQILDGAPVDVFASANPSIMEEAVAGRGGFGPRATMALNELVLVAPAANPGDVTSVQDLAEPSLFVGVCDASVPCGALAQDYFAQAGTDAEIDTFEPDVRFLVARLTEAELDAGLVYRSDVAATGEALVVIERADPAVVTSYPIAVADVDDPDAQAFVEFVLGDSGRSILERWGFVAP